MRERLKRAAAFLLCAVILSGALPLSDALSLSGAVEAAGNRVGIVRGDALRVRSAPDTSDSSNIVGYLNTGDTVTILDETTVSGSSGTRSTAKSKAARRSRVTCTPTISTS